MFKNWSNQSLTSKALSAAAIGMGVGFGTCGLTLLTTGGNGSVAQFIAAAGSVLFFASLATLVMTVLIYVCKQIVESSRK
jgi:hypothetical protein